MESGARAFQDHYTKPAAQKYFGTGTNCAHPHAELRDSDAEPNVVAFTADKGIGYTGSSSGTGHRWSSASLTLDEGGAPDTHSAGSFASWVRPSLGGVHGSSVGVPAVQRQGTSQGSSSHPHSYGLPAGTLSPARRGSTGSNAINTGCQTSSHSISGGSFNVMLTAAVHEDVPYLPEQEHHSPAGHHGNGGNGCSAGPSRLHQVAMANEGRHYQQQYHGHDGQQQYEGQEYQFGHYGKDHAQAIAAAAAGGDGAAVSAMTDSDSGGRSDGSGYDGGDGSDVGVSSAAAAGWPADPEGMLALLHQQRGQYRSWVAQCAATALAALDPDYDPSGPVAAPLSSLGSVGEAEGGPAAQVPGEVPGMVAAMDVAGQARHYLLMLKAAAESAREAGRALSDFEALSLPPLESSDGSADPAALAAGEAAEAEYVSAAYAVTTAISNAAAQVDALREHYGSAEELLRHLGTSGVGSVARVAHNYSSTSGSTSATQDIEAATLEAPLSRRLADVGSALSGRLQREAAELLTALRWPPALVEEAETASGSEVERAALDGGGVFNGFEAHPVVARRLVGVLTALTHFQMAVEQRPAFLRLLAGPQRRSLSAADSGYEDDNGKQQDQGHDGGEGEPEELSKPLLWAAKVLAEPVSRRLRSHFHPGAPTGRLDRPAWLFATSLSWLQRHGHCLAALDDMLACLQLKPHYNMPAEFTRAVQEEVLALLRDVRLPALMAASAEAELKAVEAAAEGGVAVQAEVATAAATAEAAAAAGGLWTSLMDAAAAWDIALLPLLGAGGPAAQAAAARAGALLEGYTRAGEGARGSARACDVLDPLSAGGTADMHARFVAVAAVALPAREGAVTPAVLPSTSTAAARDNTQMIAAGQQRPFGPALAAWAAAEGGAALRTMEAAAYDDSCLLAPAEEATTRALGLSDEPSESNGAFVAATAAIAMAGGAAAPPGPWQRDTWPSVLAAEAAAVLDGLVARSRWLAAAPTAQAAWLEAAAGPVLGLLKRRLGRLVEVAVAGGDALGEVALPKVCAALCAARHLDDHLHSLLLTELAPLVAALERLNAVVAGPGAAGDSSVPGSPASRGTGSVAAVASGKLGNGGFWGGLLSATGGAASPARLALQEGVTALGGGTSVASAVPGGVGGGAGGRLPPVLGEYVAAFGRLHRDGCLRLAREVALGFGRHSVAYRHAIEANPQFPFLPDEDLDEALNGGRLGGAEEDGEGVRPAASITPSFAPALLFLQTTLHRLSRACDKVTFADVWRGAALSINRFVFNFIATESRFTRPGARQFAADVAGLAQLFVPYTRRGGAGGGTRPGVSAAGGQHFRELQAAARLLCLGDEEAADVMRRASVAAVAARAGTLGGGTGWYATTYKSCNHRAPHFPASAAATTATPSKSSRSHPAKLHSRGDPVRAGMASDPVLSAAGMAVLSPLQIMNVIEHRM